MSEDTKRNGTGAASPSVDDRKSSIGSNPSKKVIIKSADMKEDIQKEAIDIAIGAFEKFSVEKDVAEHIKKTFDKKYGPTWHCIVGKNFVLKTLGVLLFLTLLFDEAVNIFSSYAIELDVGLYASVCSYVTHETHHFVYFYLDTKAVLLFKSG
ncbi:hypothetical protein SASPL_100324 [Salvia splendens]|uniref:Dynein light chain n=1 Tax=Salvia splendens TaxID=180675 RepID=A0A8X8YM63_SALSN|nr:hypothetical protein SASPL_100324 [Salvia splendens]